jgi:AraC-like DNA-binding protein
LASLKDFVASHVDKGIFIILGRRQSLDQLTDGTPDFTQWAEFHCLSLELPPLYERRADIRPLGEFFLQQAEVKLALSEAAWALLENYNWPENGVQLQAVLKKAASLASGSLSSEQLQEWFPSLCAAPIPSLAQLAAPPEATSAVAPSSIEPVLQNSLQERRLSAFAWFGLQRPENEHPALVRALDFIWNHYQQALALADVASKACISASHLSYLFKLRLQRSFKQIMTEIRIDKAKHIFENMPARQITQVCLDVGFADLSHFEKTFKRMVGLNPRCYRQQFRPPLSTQS